ncbi:glycosyltransferase [Acidimicrobiaceae bacterium]|nr:glycosyltransferase [Acidimicrobiaceae bacterium]
MNDRLLILNLGIDSDNTSLAFTQTWVNELSQYYKEIDVITLRVGTKYKLNKNVNLHYINNKNSNKSKSKQIIDLYKISKKLINNNKYIHCFAHMAPLQHLLAKYFLHKNKIKTTLWFTHIGPKFGIKWIILWLSSFLADNIVTASKNSFPFKFNNIIITGHGINFEQFFNTKEKFELKNFLILSRISKSKNIENTIENFKKITNFEKCKLDIIGGTLNSNDEEYLEYLKTKYFQYKNIQFLGKKSHDTLPEILKKYDVSINNTSMGFFDKAVLESAAGGLICFYKSNDFNFLYQESFQKILLFKEDNLYEKINLLSLQSNTSIIESIQHSQKEAEKHSLNNVTTKLVKIFNSN